MSCESHVIITLHIIIVCIGESLAPVCVCTGHRQPVLCVSLSWTLGIVISGAKCKSHIHTLNIEYLNLELLLSFSSKMETLWSIPLPESCCTISLPHPNSNTLTSSDWQGMATLWCTTPTRKAVWLSSLAMGNFSLGFLLKDQHWWGEICSHSFHVVPLVFHIYSTFPFHIPIPLSTRP